MRSEKAYLLLRLCPRIMWASSRESTMARLASSGSTSIRPRLSTMVLPALKLSNGKVSIARDQVQAPAIHVEEIRIARARLVGAIETHNVVVLILHPDAAHEPAFAGVLLRSYGEHQAAHVA